MFDDFIYIYIFVCNIGSKFFFTFLKKSMAKSTKFLENQFPFLLRYTVDYIPGLPCR